MLRPRASGPASGLYYRGAYAALDFASRIYELDDVSYTAGGLTTVSGFTFTGASLRMGYDSTGKLTYGPNNLIVRSQEFDNGSWLLNGATIAANSTAAPDGTTTADTLVEDSSTGNHYVRQLVTTSAGAHTFSVYVKAAGRSYVMFFDNTVSVAQVFNLTNGTVGGNAGVNAPTSAAIQSVGNGWYRCSMTLTTTAASNDFRVYSCFDGTTVPYTGNGTASLYLWGAQLEAVTYATTPAAYMPTTSADYYGPRLVYDPVTLASLGILVEEARTNLCLQSQTFDSGTWDKADTTITANQIASPDGTTNADLVTASAGTSIIPRVGQVITVASATVYTYSFYVKAGTYSFLQVYINGKATDWVNFNLATGAVGTTGGSVTGSVTSVGGGYYRCAMTYTADGTDRYPLTMLAASASATRAQTWSPAGTETVYLWQAQLEAGTGASSPIPTTTAAVTRAADSANLTGIILSSAFTLVSEARADAGSGVVNTFRSATVSDGTTNNRLGHFNSGTALRAVATVAAVGVVAESGTQTAGAPFKQATKFDGASTFSTSGNGAAVVSGTSAINPASLTQLGIGGLPGIASSVNSTISRIRIYNRALSDAQLQALTA